MNSSSFLQLRNVKPDNLSFFSSQTATLCQHWQLKQLLPHLSDCAVLEIYFWLTVFQTSSQHGCTDRDINTMEGWEGKNAIKPRSRANVGSESPCAGGIAPPRLWAEGAQWGFFPWVHLSCWMCHLIATMKTTKPYETSATAITKPRNILWTYCCFFVDTS